MKISLFKVSLILLLIIIACLLALNLISRFHLLLEKIPGSFEYVRTGEDFAKKGDYKAAVSYFEKANSASPGNRSIKSSLVYAYTKWGEYVADDGRYDEAIEYLKKAYEAIQDTSTIQNLAFMYSKKALDEARRNAWLDATVDYARSRAIAQDSDIARKNLSISLFNDSVSEYKIAEDNIAILCLKESSLAYEEPKTFEFLGDIYYKKTELDKALFYWDKARELVPDNKDISEKLEKLAKEMVLGKTASVKEYPHFELRLGKGIGNPCVKIDLQVVEDCGGTGSLETLDVRPEFLDVHRRHVQALLEKILGAVLDIQNFFLIERRVPQERLVHGIILRDLAIVGLPGGTGPFASQSDDLLGHPLLAVLPDDG